MLGATTRLLAAAAIGSVTVVLAAMPAAGQIDPDPIDCGADPTAAECQDEKNPPGGDDSPPGGERVCSFEDAEVPCSTSYGSWVGDVVDGDWYGLSGDIWPVTLVGCWATVTSADRDPPSTYPGEASSGAWYTLSCLGPGGGWPAPGPTDSGLDSRCGRRRAGTGGAGPPGVGVDRPERAAPGTRAAGQRKRAVGYAGVAGGRGVRGGVGADLVRPGV
jgi:hypothetical protein